VVFIGSVKSILLFGLCAVLSIPICLAAEEEPESPEAGLAVRFVFNGIFGTNACTAESLAKTTSDAGRMTFAENFALLDGKVRIELGSSQFKDAHLSQVDAYQYGLDKVTIFRPDLRLCYTIFPQLKAYVVEREPTNTTASAGPPMLRMEDQGQAELGGHPCVKRLAVIANSAGAKHQVLCWLARDLKYFPVRTQFTEENRLEITTYRNIRFARPDPHLFEPPSDYKLCRDMEEVMNRVDKMGAPTISNSTFAVEESMETLVKFTLRSGTNRPVGSNTANAFGLGTAPIPAMQIALGSKENPLIGMFGISRVNSNDLFFAQIDRNTRSGTVWLTSPAGKLRGAVSTSTNGAKAISLDGQEDKYEQVRAAFFLVSEPPVWEDAPHPLHKAAEFGELSDVEGILKVNGKLLNSVDEMGDTPLNCAVVQEREDVVEFLLAHGADPNIPDRNGLTPLEQACSRDKAVGLALASLLLAKGAQINPTNETEFSTSPLEWAVTSDNPELVNFLLERGASVKPAKADSETPLHTAASRGNLEITEALIKHGADVNASFAGGLTPLHEAAEGGYVEVAKLLLSRGAEVDRKDSSGMTPLLWAASRGADHKGPACFELLLEKGASLEATDNRGDTALHLAVSYGNESMVESLLKHGINVNAKNQKGDTPLKLAKKPKIVELLKQHGARE
jgi:ankyrin repeat protein